MTTGQSNKLNDAILRNLESKNTELVNQTLTELAESGNSAYIPYLIGLLHSTQNQEIKKRVSSFLAELKHRDAIPMLIDAIRDERYAGELHILVSACWENGLNYTEHLPLFIDLMLERDFMVAFEAHTVITNMTGKISAEWCREETRKITQALPSLGVDKRGLLEEILNFLPALEAGIEPQEY